MLVTALIRYIYKELAIGCPAKLLLHQAKRFSKPHKLPTASLASVNITCSRLQSLLVVVQSRPMVVHLVGLGGSLEGRVAGVVLELVGCREEGRRLVVVFVVNVCIFSDEVRLPLISSGLRSSSSPWTPEVQKDRTRERTGSKSGGERVDAVCDDQACDETALAPLSPKCILRALALLIQVESVES